MNDARIVTVDGPAGSGKTTLGRHLASALLLPLIDSGLFYRGVMVAAVRAGITGEMVDRLIKLSLTTVLEINTSPENEDWLCRVDGSNAGPALRDPDHAILVSTLSQIPEVRTNLLDAQRALATHGAVAVGRDCGTVVFPGAAAKFYLEAPTDVRAGRRAQQLGTTDAVTLQREVQGRDTIDSSRAVAPMRPAADAIMIDTSRVGIEAMVAQALTVCAERGVR